MNRVYAAQYQDLPAQSGAEAQSGPIGGLGEMNNGEEDEMSNDAGASLMMTLAPSPGRRTDIMWRPATYRYHPE